MAKTDFQHSLALKKKCSEEMQPPEPLYYKIGLDRRAGDDLIAVTRRNSQQMTGSCNRMLRNGCCGLLGEERYRLTLPASPRAGKLETPEAFSAG